jgi:N-acetylneuraminate synthase/sialic acid synthase
MRQLLIDGVTVSDDSHCYVIAEIGNNHQGELEKCKQLFLAAKQAGATAVKLQKRNNRALFTKAMYDQPYNSENAFGATYGTHRDFLEFGRDEYVELKKYAAELGITFFATAFDISSADFLQSLDMPVYKIASGDLKNTPLLKHVAAIGKPMIISTGGGAMEDVRRAYDAIMPINQQLCILQCTASYPCDTEKLNLRVIETFRSSFPETVIGLSSHDNGIAMPLAAYMLGARVVEKHFTLNRSWKGTDHAFSLTPDGLRKMVRDLHRTHDALGDGVKAPLPEEQAPLLKMGKKLVIAHDLAAGTVLTAKDITVKSPADGIQPYDMDRVIGRTLKTALREDDTLSWDHLAS